MISVDAGRWVGGVVLGLAGIANASAGDLPECPTEAFSDVSAAQRASLMSGACSTEHARWQIDTPRARPVDPGPSLVKTQFTSATSQQLFSALLGTLKFNWAAQRSEDSGSLRTEQAAVAAGGLLRLDDMFALQMNLGHELSGETRSRATMASIWQPTRQALVFAEWADSYDNNSPAERRVGARWWLLPRMLVIDVGARYVPEGVGWVDQRIGLTFQLPH